MSELYNQTFADHYSAYRPPLHQIILELILSGNDTFQNGLDIGCGTGYSAVALTKYCSHVYGIDPSESMLKQAALNEKITYVKGTGDSLFLQDDTIDIVTFAGSLFYAKSPELIQELKRVCKDHCTITVYDFEILFDRIFDLCGIKYNQAISGYNHKVNFSDIKEFNEIIIRNEQIKIEVTSTELAHLLLADSNIYQVFLDKYKQHDHFPSLVNELESFAQTHQLDVTIYYSKYQI